MLYGIQCIYIIRFMISLNATKRQTPAKFRIKRNFTKSSGTFSHLQQRQHSERLKLIKKNTKIQNEEEEQRHKNKQISLFVTGNLKKNIMRARESSKSQILQKKAISKLSPLKYQKQKKELIHNDLSLYKEYQITDFIIHKGSKGLIRAYWKQNNREIILKKQKIINFKANKKQILQILGSIKSETPNEEYIILPIDAQYSLKDYLREFGKVDQKLGKKIIKNIVKGVAYLHSKNIVHSDLTLDKIYHNFKSEIFIDISEIHQLQTIQKNQSYQSKIQIPMSLISEEKKLAYFQSPESLNREKCRSSTDIWSIGCIALQLLYGSIDSANKIHPYNEIKNLSPQGIIREYPLIELIHNRLNEGNDIGESVDQHIEDRQPVVLSVQAKQFIRQCLLINQEKRPLALHLLNHIFLR